MEAVNKKKYIRTALTIAGILLLMNFPPIRWVFYLVDHQDVNYANASGTFTFEEMNSESRNYSMCLNRWIDFKRTGHADTILYRITPKNYLEIWNYKDYLFAEKFKYSFKKVVLQRGPAFERTGYQDY